MASRKIRRPLRTRAKRASKSAESATHVWSGFLEKENWLKAPRTIFFLGRYENQIGARLEPRHILLILKLAASKYQDKPIRFYWETLARDLGVKRDTVRKWGYELKRMGLLKITQHRGRPSDKGPGFRNDKNSFDISPFVEKLERAYREWLKTRSKPNGDTE